MNTLEYEVYDFLDEDLAAEPEAVYSINSELSLAGHIVNDTGANLFLTGKAGTGKTTFLRRLRETSGKRMVVLAPTGVAAINAEGVTIHSFFQLGFSPYIPGKGYAEEQNRHYSFSKQKRRLISTLDLIVIDEISMVRPDTLDAMDATLRRLRGNSAPFGGVQLLLIGDLRQLSPVVRDDEWRYLSAYYQSPYFFESHALKSAGFLTIELHTVYRQTDRDFIEILNAVRDGNVDISILNALNSRCIPGFNPPQSEGYIHLTTHNYIASNHNSNRLRALPSAESIFEAEVKGEFPEYSFPADKTLVLKEGAQVMFIKNDQGSDRKYYNGLIGTVTNIGENAVTVVPNNGEPPIEIGYVEWENTKYLVDESSGDIRSEVVGTFSQVPLRLAWAITIHKSQGLTFDRAIIDAAQSFAPGQTYVALSRCRSIEGMVLTAPIQPESVIVDSHVNDFVKDYEGKRPDSDTLTSLRGEYTRSAVVELFDFSPIRHSFDDFRKAMIDFVIPMYPELRDALDDEFMRVMQKVVDVASKFKQLYASQPIDPDSIPSVVIDKIKSGSHYFAKEIVETLRYISNLDIKLDNQAYITRLNNVVDDLRFRLGIKLDILRQMENIDFSTAEYNRAKTNAVLRNDDVPKKAYTSKRKKDPGTKKPKGYSQNLTLTLYKDGKTIEQIAKERNLNPSTIAGHLAEFVSKGDLNIHDLVSEDHLKRMEEVYGDGSGGYASLSALRESGEIPPEEISIFYRSRKVK